ncbi:DUF547 domain-containing protein [Pontibacter akesuensis]|nr:DUF547 domain-containing protein [Pontibacter akesuensis]
MFLLFVPAAVILPVSSASAAAVTQDNFYTSTTELLQRHVKQGQVNYRSLQQDGQKLKQLVQQVAAYNLSNASAAERKAFYINAYNLLVLQQVLEHYPLKSVMDVKGFFDGNKYKVAGESLTLNQLEKQKLLEPFNDARVHFAVVCAAKSCPPLLSEAYTPQKVEQQLQAQAERTLQGKQFIKVQPQNRKVLVSEIFNWYKSDFGSSNNSILAYINRYRTQAVPKNYDLGYYTYNWQLNDISGK